MELREFFARAVRELETVLRDDRSARIAALTGLAMLLVLSIVTVLVTRLRRRSRASADEPIAGDRGDWGTGLDEAEIEADRRWPIDSILPRRIGGAVLLALVVAAALWLTGLWLAPNIPTFLASPEWQFQPLYVAGHILAVRLFVMAYTRGFARGIARFAVPEDRAATLINRVLGFPGAVFALAIALPFVALDFLYLFSPRYQRMGGPDSVLPIDYLMWGIWSVEWFLNAFIWVVLVGFLIKTAWVIRAHPFRAPIEIVLHDKHYRPFLQMSAQGATIVLAFTVLTVGYIWYTGGELTDYAGLVVTAILLVASFIPSLLLMRSKVSRAVEDETMAMRKRLIRDLALAEHEMQSSVVHGQIGGPAQQRSLEHRLDAAVAILRISYLEGRHEHLGSTEARAVLIRMLAPALSVGWQVAKSHGNLLAEFQTYLQKFF